MAAILPVTPKPPFNFTSRKQHVTMKFIEAQVDPNTIIINSKKKKKAGEIPTRDSNR